MSDFQAPRLRPTAVPIDTFVAPAVQKPDFKQDFQRDLGNLLDAVQRGEKKRQTAQEGVDKKAGQAAAQNASPASLLAAAVPGSEALAKQLKKEGLPVSYNPAWQINFRQTSGNRWASGAGVAGAFSDAEWLNTMSTPNPQGKFPDLEVEMQKITDKAWQSLAGEEVDGSFLLGASGHFSALKAQAKQNILAKRPGNQEKQHIRNSRAVLGGKFKEYAKVLYSSDNATDRRFHTSLITEFIQSQVLGNKMVGVEKQDAIIVDAARDAAFQSFKETGSLEMAEHLLDAVANAEIRPKSRFGSGAGVAQQLDAIMDDLQRRQQREGISEAEERRRAKSAVDNAEMRWVAEQLKEGKTPTREEFIAFRDKTYGDMHFSPEEAASIDGNSALMSFERFRESERRGDDITPQEDAEVISAVWASGKSNEEKRAYVLALEKDKPNVFSKWATQALLYLEKEKKAPPEYRSRVNRLLQTIPQLESLPEKMHSEQRRVEMDVRSEAIRIYEAEGDEAKAITKFQDFLNNHEGIKRLREGRLQNTEWAMTQSKEWRGFGVTIDNQTAKLPLGQVKSVPDKETGGFVKVSDPKGVASQLRLAAEAKRRLQQELPFFIESAKNHPEFDWENSSLQERQDFVNGTIEAVLPEFVLGAWRDSLKQTQVLGDRIEVDATAPNAEPKIGKASLFRKDPGVLRSYFHPQGAAGRSAITGLSRIISGQSEGAAPSRRDIGASLFSAHHAHQYSFRDNVFSIRRPDRFPSVDNIWTSKLSTPTDFTPTQIQMAAVVARLRGGNFDGGGPRPMYVHEWRKQLRDEGTLQINTKDRALVTGLEGAQADVRWLAGGLPKDPDEVRKIGVGVLMTRGMTIEELTEGTTREGLLIGKLLGSNWRHELDWTSIPLAASVQDLQEIVNERGEEIFAILGLGEEEGDRKAFLAAQSRLISERLQALRKLAKKEQYADQDAWIKRAFYDKRTVNLK